MTAPLMLAALTMFPVPMNEFVREPGWPVMPVGVAPKAIVIATLPSAGTAKSNGSENTAWFCAMVTDAAPENVTALSVAMLMELPVVASATWTAFIVTGPEPNSFDRRRRACEPLIDVKTIWRSVLLVRPGGLGGLLPVSVSCGPVAH